jgi:hypothetical protein
MQNTDFGGPVSTVWFRLNPLGALARGSTAKALV